MRNLFFSLLLIASAYPGFASTRVTVKQLEGMLATAPTTEDMHIARRIGGLQLTERLSEAEYSMIAAKLPGPFSREALLAIADEAEFLGPPASEIPPTPAPDANAQSRIIGLATDYVKRTLPGLPNFLATRKDLRFQDRLLTAEMNVTNDKSDLPLQPVERSTATVVYRNGREAINHSVRTDGLAQGKAAGLNTSGAFGPILGTVLDDSAHARMLWSRWEQGSGGLLAVFHFEVPKGKSHYLVSYCCVPRNPNLPYNSKNTDQNGLFQELAGYHGEITVDPANGVILRLALKADLDFMLPIARADTFVQYGPVEIGGETYICPLKSVSISQARARLKIEEWNQFRNVRGLMITVVDDILFEDYQRFRGDMRILSGDYTDTDKQSNPKTPSGPIAAPIPPQ